jgi:hypothetical protein
MDHISTYIKSYYGQCLKEPCACRKDSKPQASCFNWKPVDANDWEEMKATMIKIRDNLNNA